MKIIIFISLICGVFLFSCKKNHDSPLPVVDSFSVVVAGGYGSGRYAAGDTVHVWSKETGRTEVLSNWGGSDVGLLQDPKEWHTWFIMPAKAVDFSTSYLSGSSPFTLQELSVMGRDRMKPVYYYVPSFALGVCFLLHGSGGSAEGLVNNAEVQYIIKTLAFKRIGVVITESEETTAGQDLNGDGFLRWQQLPADTAANVDYANIRRITNSLVAANVFAAHAPRHALGMSAGGAFAHALGLRLGHRSAISIAAPAGAAITSLTQARSLFLMAANDAHPSVGPAGNAAAATDVQALQARNICARLRTHYRSPLYPQRFARMMSISLATSASIFHELKAKGYLDNRNFFTAPAASIRAAFLANRNGFRVMNELTLLQQQFVFDQIDVCRADHELFSDYSALATEMMLSQSCP